LFDLKPAALFKFPMARLAMIFAGLFARRISRKAAQAQRIF
jgi:hypothetical protein